MVSDPPEFRYTVFSHGEEWLAGVNDKAAGQPEQRTVWCVYFGADDTDGTLAKVEELGGSVLVPAADTDYGRLALASDPTGAQFNIVAANEAMPAKN